MAYSYNLGSFNVNVDVGLRYTYSPDTRRSYSTQKYDVPLKQTEVTVDTLDCLGKMKVKQTYKNSNSFPIEALYVFPACTDMCVTDFRATFGNGTTLVAEVKRKDTAEKTYKEAKSSGKKTCLLEEYGRTYKISVGNLDANETVVIEYSCNMTLETIKYESQQAFKFVFPTNIAPKYLSADHSTKDELNHPASTVKHSNSVDYKFMITVNCIKCKQFTPNI